MRTAAKKFTQAVSGGGIAGTPDTDVVTVQGIAGGTPLDVTGSGVVIPVPVPVTDNGGSLTVDDGGTPLQVNTEFAGNTDNNDAKAVSATTDLIAGVPRLYAYNGTAFDRLRAFGDNADAVTQDTLGRLLTLARSYIYTATGAAAGNWSRNRFPRHDGQSVATQTSAANTAQTLTIAAPGSGMRIYITYLRIARIATAALAGGALLAYTSAGLNGLAWSVGNAMAAGGTSVDVDKAGQPLFAAASTAGAVSITVPACGAAVISQITIGYYVA